MDNCFAVIKKWGVPVFLGGTFGGAADPLGGRDTGGASTPNYVGTIVRDSLGEDERP